MTASRSWRRWSSVRLPWPAFPWTCARVALLRALLRPQATLTETVVWLVMPALSRVAKTTTRTTSAACKTVARAPADTPLNWCEFERCAACACAVLLHTTVTCRVVERAFGARRARCGARRRLWLATGDTATVCPSLPPSKRSGAGG